jgi:hypothetical protein
MRARVVVAALATAIGLGCSSNKAEGTGSGIAGTSSGVASASKKESRQQDLITESEITSRAADATNAYQIVQKLRPQMLRSRGAVSTNPNDPTGQSSMPRVYVDNVSYGNVESLANLNASQVKEIRFLNSRDATTQYGTGHVGGVILVLTKK